MSSTVIEVYDVIQLGPEHHWGPLLCIVTEVRDWGVQCYALVPEKRGEQPGAMFLRVEYGKFERVGRAAWTRAE